MNYTNVFCIRNHFVTPPIIFFLLALTNNVMSGDNYLLSPATMTRLHGWHNDTHVLALIPFILTNNNVLRACIAAYVFLDIIDIQCNKNNPLNDAITDTLKTCNTKGYVFMLRTCIIIGLLVAILTDVHYKATNKKTAYFAYAIIALPIISEIISYMVWHGSTWEYMSQHNYGKDVFSFSTNYKGYFWHGLGHVGIWVGLILILLLNKDMTMF